jgi:hypothetical protein
MATDLSAYHRERRASVEQLNRSMLESDKPAHSRHHLRWIVIIILIGTAAAVAGAFAAYI